MGIAFDHAETTLVWDYPRKEIELYTTDRRLWLRCIRRNPNFKVAQDLEPGYRLVYDLGQVRRPESLIVKAPGGDEKQLEFLNERELLDRQKKRDLAKQERFGCKDE